MTNEEIRISIAEFCGWRQIQQGARAGLWRWSDIPKGGSSSILSDILPDYPNDLNAMHEAEKRIAEITIGGLYCDNLAAIVGLLQCDIAIVCKRFNPSNSMTHPSHHHWPLAHATASQRAEATLRTIGKWKE